MKKIKKAIPLFALLGGQGMASNRVNSISLNSKKFANKSLMFIHESNKHQNFETIKQPISNNPFAVFSYKNSKPSSKKFNTNTQALDYLEKNELLKAKPHKTVAKISGHKTQSKTFSHPFVFAANTINCGPSNNNPSFAQATYFKAGTLGNKYFCSMTFSITTIPTTFLAEINMAPKSTNHIYYSDTNKSQVQKACQIMHNYCFHGKDGSGRLLPVELEKFEVE